MQALLVTIFITLSLLLTGCNEEAGLPTDTRETTKIAYGSVQGLTYICSSGVVGTTDSNGSYMCDDIDNVTLYLGDTKISTVLPEDGLITPYDFFPQDNLSALNYIRLVTALDANASDNIITLDPEKIALLPKDLDFSDENFEYDVETSLSTKQNLHLMTLTEAQKALNQILLDQGKTIPQGSHQPVAIITYTKNGTNVVLNGESSYDADNDHLTYKWTLSTPSGSSSQLTNSTHITSSFAVDKTGTYTISLQVKDGTVFSEITTKPITIDSTITLPPLADAGNIQEVLVNTLVTLNATKSSNEGGDALTYLWTQVGGVSVTLSDTSSVVPTFTPTVTGAYLFKVTVSNSNGSSNDITTINVADGNVKPVADAGIDQEVITNSLVTLDASKSNDANNNPLTYAWSVINTPTGITTTLSNPAAPNPTFTPYADGNYIFALIVNDGLLNSSQDTVLIHATTANVAPIANAGTDQNAKVGNLVTLDASASSDGNNDVITYQWNMTVPSTSGASLTNPTTFAPSFVPDIAGTYTLQLVVNDGHVDSASDFVSITVTTSNAIPTTNAGVDASVDVNTAYTLNGSGSDGDNDPITYQWSIFSKPTSSASGLFLDNTNPLTSFTPDTVGTYILQLIANDTKAYSLPDKMILTVKAVQGFDVKKTGQTVSERSGDDGFYSSSVGTSPSYTRTSEIVTDHITNLQWQDNNPTSYQPISGSSAPGYCSNLVLGGQTDWRLPSSSELLNLMRRGSSSPSIDTNYFQTMQSFRQLWSSNSGYFGQVLVDFNSGGFSFVNSGQSYPVRCVRGVDNSVLPVPDSTNQVVIDTQRKLMWQDTNMPSNKEWPDALSYCENLSLNGVSDWRLPNINEILTIVDFNNRNSSLISIFANKPLKQESIWTSTINPNYTPDALILYNTSETTGFIIKKTTYYEPNIASSEKRSSSLFSPVNKHEVKCVRSLP